MKKFFADIALFTIMLITITTVADFGISEVVKKSDLAVGEYFVWNDIFSKNLKTDIAIYGSSKAKVQYSPDIISKITGKSVYNFGVDGHNFFMQEIRHQKYFQLNAKPKTIILSVDIFSLQKRKDLYNYEQFLPYLFWENNQNIKTDLLSYEGLKSLDFYLPFYRYRGKANLIFTSFLQINHNHKNPKGFFPNNKNWNGDFEKVKHDLLTYKIDVDKISKNKFLEFLDKITSQNIKLILVYPPEYYELGKIIKTRNNMIEFYKTEAEKRKIPFLDYSKDSLCYDTKNFYNATHLNKKGSEIFSEKLAHKIKNLK